MKDKTKIIFNINKKDGSVYFEAMGHAGDHDTCMHLSALYAVITSICEKADIPISVQEEEHMKVCIENAGTSVIWALEAVQNTLFRLTEIHSDTMKIY